MVEVEWLEHGVRWKYAGPVRGEDIIKACTSVYSDKRFDDLRYKLCDFLEADSFNMTAREMSKVVCQQAAAAYTNPDIKIAIVGNKARLPDLALLVEHFTNYKSAFVWPVKLFEDVASARAWLAA